MNELILLIRRQTTILFSNVDEILNTINDSQLDNAGSWGWPVGEQIYHLLHSLDQWFINPYDYVEPAWLPPDARLSKSELVAYFASIRAKVEQYLETLEDQALREYPKGSRFARLELILGQYRHLMYHIGLLHGCLRSERGQLPEFIGLSAPVAPVSRG